MRARNSAEARMGGGNPTQHQPPIPYDAGREWCGHGEVWERIVAGPKPPISKKWPLRGSLTEFSDCAEDEQLLDLSGLRCFAWVMSTLWRP